LTAGKALKKLQTSVLKNDIYVGEQQIVDGKDTQTGFTNNDLQGGKQRLKDQWSLFPSFKEKDYTLYLLIDDFKNFSNSIYVIDFSLIICYLQKFYICNKPDKI
jgi:hypothetical protein